MTHPARLSVGSSPLVHMMLLARAPERILALRLAFPGPDYSTVMEQLSQPRGLRPAR